MHTGKFKIGDRVRQRIDIDSDHDDDPDFPQYRKRATGTIQLVDEKYLPYPYHVKLDITEDDEIALRTEDELEFIETSKSDVELIVISGST